MAECVSHAINTPWCASYTTILYDTLVWMMIVSNADISKNIFINQKQMPWYFYYYFGLTAAAAAAAAKGRLCVFCRWKSRQGHSHKLFIANFKNSCNPLTHHSLTFAFNNPPSSFHHHLQEWKAKYFENWISFLENTPRMARDAEWGRKEVKENGSKGD